MSAIAHAIVTQTTDQNHGTGSTGYVDISGTTLASSEFVAGETYLLLVMAQTQGSNAAGQCAFRVVHGSTAFDDSTESFETVSTGTGKRQWYFWWHIWTAVSGEDVKAQFDNVASADDVFADAVQIFAMRIHDFASADRQFNERPDDDALSTTPLDGASVTFSADGSDVWLLLTAAWLDPGSTTTSVKSRANLDGTTYGEAINEGEDTSLDRFVMCTAVPAVPSNGSHTLKEQSTTTSGTAHTRLHSKVAAINLSAYFKDVSQAYTATPLAAGTTQWGDAVQTLSHTKTVNGNVLVITSFIQKTAANSWTYRSRLQTDNADTPDGQTAPNANSGYTGGIRVADGANDATGFTAFALVNLTDNATFDADGYVDTAVAGREYQSRGIVAFSMELISAGGGNNYSFSGTVSATSTFITIGSALEIAHTLISSIAGVVATTGNLPIIHSLDGNIVGVSALTDQLFITKPITGNITGLSDVTSTNLLVAHALEGTCAGLAILSAQLAVSHSLQGIIAGISDLTAVCRAQWVLFSSIDGVAAFTGSLSVSRPLTGQIVAQSTIEDTDYLAVHHALQGICVDTSNLVGNLVVTITLTGNITGVSTLTDLATVHHSLQGTIVGTSVFVDAQLDRAQFLVGNITASSNLVGSLTVVHPLEGSIVGISNISDTYFVVAHSLQGNIVGTSTLTTNILVAYSLSGTIVGTSDVRDSFITVHHSLEGIIVGTAIVNDTDYLTVNHPLEGLVAGDGSFSGGADRDRGVLGSINGTSALTGTLTVESPPAQNTRIYYYSQLTRPYGVF